jgi:hypothetical protein
MPVKWIGLSIAKLESGVSGEKGWNFIFQWEPVHLDVDAKHFLTEKELLVRLPTIHVKSRTANCQATVTSFVQFSVIIDFKS